MKHLRKYGMFYASAAMLACSMILLVLALRAEHRAAALSRPSVTQEAFKLGQEVSMGQVKLRLSDAQYTNGSGVFSAPADKHYLIMTLHIKNFSTQPINVLPASDTYVKTADGQVTYLTPYNLKNPFRPGELLPGEEISGQVSYLIAKDVPVKFFADAIWSGGVIPVKTK